MGRAEIDLDQARELYINQKLTLKETVKRMGVPYRHLRNALIYSGIKIRGSSPRKRIPIDKEQLEELYLKQRLSTTGIAKVLGTHQATVWRNLHDFDIPMRTVRDGQRNAKAQGKSIGGHRLPRMEQVKDTAGYIMRCLPTHPRSNNRGYIALHTLVWEEGHSKPVPVGGVIHHINGVKADNLLENLHMFLNKEHTKFHIYARFCAFFDGHLEDRRKACPPHLLEQYFREWQMGEFSSNRKWYLEHVEQTKKDTTRRRYLKKTLPNTLTEAEWQQLLSEHNYCCHYCGSSDTRLDRDRKVPGIKGGEYTKENIVPACRSCNSRKNTRDYEEFVALLKREQRED